MMRPSSSRPALAVLLTLALLTTLTLGPGAATANGAEPADSDRLVSDELTISQDVVSGSLVLGASPARLADEGSARFAFSVLSQAVTSVQKTISQVGGVNQPAGTTSVNAAPGQTIQFTITGSNIQTGFIRDFLSPNFTFVSASVACVAAPAPGQQGVVTPTGVSGNATVRDCPVATTGNVTFTINATVSPATGTNLPTTDPAANIACAGQVPATQTGQTGDPGTCSLPVQVGLLATAATATPTVTGTPVPAATATPTRTVTPTGVPTNIIATVVAAVTPVALVPCATQIGQQCTVTGTNVNGFGTKVGSMTWTLSVTAGIVPAGTVATIVIPTTVAPAGEVLLGAGGAPACPVATAAATLVCTGTTLGDGLVGGTVLVVVPGGIIVATGTIQPAAPLPGPPVIAPGAAGIAAIPRVAIPAAPAPPVQFIPPAPPPLLPPIGPLPPLQGGRPPAFPEVPVIPEADTLGLLVGGIVALGGYAALRQWRGRRRQD